MKSWFREPIVALQFMTRLPMPSIGFDPDGLSHAAKYLPLVGLVIGLAASLLSHLLTPHLSRAPAALLVLTFLVMVTGALHEDGLADSADGFGGGWERGQVLAIMRDSRIGSYGAIAIVLSLLARFLLLSTLSPDRFTAVVVSAQVLCRWTTLPLGRWMRPAREDDGQGVRIAQRVPPGSLFIGTVFTAAAVVWAFRTEAWVPAIVSIGVTLVSGLYFQHRIGGVTGDCFGATNQLTEIAVYFCGVWHR
jgi:adenosylcobinamide-GDP ribazoletransferase